MIGFRRFALLAGLLTALAAAPARADLPAIRLSATNRVPGCVTPGRLMSYLKSRNRRLDPKFEAVAVEYMRHGEGLGVRWDIAFFQMMIETANLSFTGQVQPEQNNFAGLGATQGSRGESFRDVSTGVRAHLEHVLLYSGAHIDNPVAERTRKLQEWNVLSTWYKDVRGPMTFAHLVRQWAPGSRTYPRDLQALANEFFTGPCRAPDPQPELAAAAREGRAGRFAALDPVPDTPTAEESRPSPAAEQAAFEADGDNSGAPPPGLGAAPAADVETAETPAVTVLNAEPSAPDRPAAPGTADAAGAVAEPPPSAAGTQNAATETARSGPPGVQTASAAGAALQAAGSSPPAAKDTPKCRVWTASYGGQKALIIKATSGKTVNYTVLDVNEGREQREAEAYIAAYAKGGEMVAEFPSQAKALDKAFELCPDG